MPCLQPCSLSPIWATWLLRESLPQNIKVNSGFPPASGEEALLLGTRVDALASRWRVAWLSSSSLSLFLQRLQLAPEFFLQPLLSSESVQTPVKCVSLLLCTEVAGSTAGGPALCVLRSPVRSLELMSPSDSQFWDSVLGCHMLGPHLLKSQRPMRNIY